MKAHIEHWMQLSHELGLFGLWILDHRIDDGEGVVGSRCRLGRRLLITQEEMSNYGIGSVGSDDHGARDC